MSNCDSSFPGHGLADRLPPPPRVAGWRAWGGGGGLSALPTQSASLSVWKSRDSNQVGHRGVCAFANLSLSRPPAVVSDRYRPQPQRSCLCIAQRLGAPAAYLGSPGRPTTSTSARATSPETFFMTAYPGSQPLQGWKVGCLRTQGSPRFTRATVGLYRGKPFRLGAVGCCMDFACFQPQRGLPKMSNCDRSFPGHGLADRVPPPPRVAGWRAWGGGGGL